MKLGTAGTINTTVGVAMGKDTPYQLQQHYIGGALSAYAGMAFTAKIAGAAKAKFAKTFAKYAVQGSASDFAYSDESYYRARNGWEHAGIFGVAGFAGVGLEHAGKIKLPLLKGNSFVARFGDQFAQRSLVYTAEFFGMAFARGGYHDLYTTKWGVKASAPGFKALVYSLILH